MLQTGVLALKEALDISGNLLPLAGKVLALGELLGGRYQVSARTLGHIHAGIGDPDDVLDRKPVRRKTVDAESASDFVLAHHRIAGNPLPQDLVHHRALLWPCLLPKPNTVVTPT